MLTARLATGNGAIYHHVANKAELLAAATERIVKTVLGELDDPSGSTADAVRTISVGLFDAIDTHPWLGDQLILEPRQPAMLEIFEVFGSRLRTFDVPDELLFNSTFALVNYVLGAAVQNAANGRTGLGGDDTTSLRATASQWAQLDAERYPFLRTAATQLAEHDDREQFLAGVDLLMGSINAAF